MVDRVARRYRPDRTVFSDRQSDEEGIGAAAQIVGIVAVGRMASHGLATFPATLRMIGFALAPLALVIFSFVRFLGPGIALIGQLLSLRAGSLVVNNNLVQSPPPSSS